MLQASAVSLTLGVRPVVDQVSGVLNPGQWTAIVGPNGAGKSSLLMMLAGLRAPTSGQISLHGQALARWPVRARAREIGWLAQQGEADGEIAAIDVVRLGRLPHHGLFDARDARDDSAVQAAMVETECLPLAERRLNQLSGGERQRVLLARVLAGETPILLLDEPGSSLDPPHQRALMRSVRSRVRTGAAAAVVLHDLNLALAADRIWLMQGGRLLIDTTPDDIRLHEALISVFDQAIAIDRLERDGGVHFSVRLRH